MSEVGTLDDAWVLIDDERIEDFGSMSCCPESEGAKVIDADGGMVMPSF